MNLSKGVNLLCHNIDILILTSKLNLAEPLHPPDPESTRRTCVVVVISPAVGDKGLVAPNLRCPESLQCPADENLTLECSPLTMGMVESSTVVIRD